MVFFPSTNQLIEYAHDNPSDEHLGRLARALIREGHAPPPHAIVNPIIVDICGSCLVLNRGTFRPFAIADHWIVALILDDVQGVSRGFHEWVEMTIDIAVPWCRYLIELAHDARRYHHGAVWLEAGDYPDGDTFKAWQEENDT